MLIGYSQIRSTLAIAVLSASVTGVTCKVCATQVAWFAVMVESW